MPTPSAHPYDSVFAQDVINGLQQSPKRLSSKYFYDDKGSEIFQQIMRMESYYLTDAELEIFTEQGDALVQACAPDGSPFRLVEFGAGDGLKTMVLIRHLLDRGIKVIYTPIDISGAAIKGLVHACGNAFPGLTVEPLQGDYFTALDRLVASGDTQRKVILFLGSNIGNFSRAAALTFLAAVRNHMNQQDRLLIGFDLKKDPHIILSAYDDPGGITREFNLNLLDRINRELGANFDRSHWRHFANYDPMTGETKSYLVSTRDQVVHFAQLGTEVSFLAWEPIWMELSQKYDDGMIRDLAQSSGFQYLEGIHDSRHYFVEAIWEWGR